MYLCIMKFQPGDIVLLLHSNEEGRVLEIINEEMVLVEIGGVAFPVFNDQIDFPYFKRFTEKNRSAGKKPKVYVDNLKKEDAVKKGQPGGMWLSFLPVFEKDVFDDEVVEKIKIYLLNQTGEAYSFRYEVSAKGKTVFELKNSVAAFSDFYLHDLPFEELNDAPRFAFVFSPVVASGKKADHFETHFKLKARQLFRYIEDMRLKNEPSFTHLLFETYPDKEVIDLPGYEAHALGTYPLSASGNLLQPVRSVVDLHIEKITDQWKGLGGFEILSLQLKEFEKYLELSIAHRQPTLTVIHGVGTGRLRDEIHEILKTKREVKTFVNQYHPLFGFGATEIYFRY